MPEKHKLYALETERKKWEDNLYQKEALEAKLKILKESQGGSDLANRVKIQEDKNQGYVD